MADVYTNLPVRITDAYDATSMRIVELDKGVIVGTSHDGREITLGDLLRRLEDLERAYMEATLLGQPKQE